MNMTELWISMTELWTSILELWISIILMIDSWIALIDGYLLEGLHFCLSTVGLLSSDLIALMSWGPFHQMIFIFISSVIKSSFVIIHFLIIRTNFRFRVSHANIVAIG